MSAATKLAAGCLAAGLSACLSQPGPRYTVVPPLESGMQRYGQMSADLASLNGAVATVSQGTANIGRVVNPVQEANNALGQGFVQVLKAQGALDSLSGRVGRMFHANP